MLSTINILRVNLKDIFIATIPVAILFFILILTDYARVGDIGLKSIILFLIFVPLVEEYLFRGLLQSMLLTRFSGSIYIVSYANIVTSIIFSLSHLFYNNLLHSFLVFFPSVVFGILYDRSRSIIPSFITHLVYNINIFIIYNIDIF